MAAGKLDCEKPLDGTAAGASEPYSCARQAGIKHGVVQAKLFLPNMLKL